MGGVSSFEVNQCGPGGIKLAIIYLIDPDPDLVQRCRIIDQISTPDRKEGEGTTKPYENL
jgi:hypothetical protein